MPILDATGAPVRSKKREVLISDPKLVTFAAQADTAFRLLELAVVCTHCAQPPRMANHPSDPNFVMECGCTVRRLRNPRAS